MRRLARRRTGGGVGKYPIVTFDWIDSSTTHGWNDLEECDFATSQACHSAGFLIHESEDSYLIADSITDESEKPNIRDHPFLCPHAVPKVAVSNFRVLVDGRS